MWLKLGISKPYVLGNELRKITKAKQAEKVEKEKAKIAKKRKLAKSEAEIMFGCVNRNL